LLAPCLQVAPRMTLSTLAASFAATSGQHAGRAVPLRWVQPLPADFSHEAWSEYVGHASPEGAHQVYLAAATPAVASPASTAPITTICFLIDIVFHPSLARSCACLTTKVLHGLRRTQFWKTLGGVLQAASARTDAEATAASCATIPLRTGHCARESHGASSLGYVSPPARRWAIGILSMLWLCTAISCAHRLVALNCASSRHPMFGRCVTMDTVFLSGERVGAP
jgi:hypothetical protein